MVDVIKKGLNHLRPLTPETHFLGLFSVPVALCKVEKLFVCSVKVCQLVYPCACAKRSASLVRHTIEDHPPSVLDEF